MKIASRPRVPGGAPEPGWTLEEHQRAAAEYWAAVGRYKGGSGKGGRTPLTASQHILHLLLTVCTCGLWALVWIFAAMRGNYADGPPVPGDRSAAMPVWPPERPGAPLSYLPTESPR